MADRKPSQQIADRIGLTFDQLREAIRVCIVACRGAILLSSPGTGKTSCLRGVAHEVEAEYMASPPLPTMDPTDLRGVPKVEIIDGIPRTIWSVPDFLPVRPPQSPSGLGIIVHDDFTTAPPAVQAPFYQLWLEGALGAYRMPEGWIQFATGNYDSDRAGTHRSLTPMRSRWITLHAISDVETYARGAVSAWQQTETIKLPKLPPRPRKIHPMVIALMRFKGDLLNKFDADQLSYPCERSWEIASDLLYAIEALGGASPLVEHALLAGTVGMGAAGEAVGFLKHYRSLPDIPGILRNPKKAIVPKEPAALYAVASALARVADDKNFGAVVEYLERIQTEFQVFAVRDAVRRDNKIGRTPAFIQWSVKNQNFCL